LERAEDLFSGNRIPSGQRASNRRGTVAFSVAFNIWTLRESLERIRVVRVDSGFFAQELLKYLEEIKLPYIVVARLTSWLKREAARVKEWRALDAVYSVGEFDLQLFAWDSARRLVVVGETT
jgi:hypothetical protein